jgi:hypothetical protein
MFAGISPRLVEGEQLASRSSAGLTSPQETYVPQLFDLHSVNAERVSYEPAPLPTALVCRSFAQHATTMFFPHFVGDACSREPHQLGEWRIRSA